MTGKLIQGGVEISTISSGTSYKATLPDTVGMIFDSSTVANSDVNKNRLTVHISGHKEGEGFSVYVPRTLEVIKRFKPGDPALQLDGGLLIKPE